MRKFTFIFGLFLLCACDHFEQDKQAVVTQAKVDAKTVQGNVTTNTMRVADNVRDSIKRTGERVREWWLTPLPSTAKRAMPTRYCYKVLQDILCYRQQMVGWESKLVGYQGGQAEPPAPAQMKPLQTRIEDPNVKPEKQVAQMKPVFVTTPVEPKESKDNTTATPDALDGTHENLPDSPLSPQL